MASGLASKTSASSGSLQGLGLDAVEASYTGEVGRLYGYIFKRRHPGVCRFEVDTSTRSSALLRLVNLIITAYAPIPNRIPASRACIYLPSVLT